MSEEELYIFLKLIGIEPVPATDGMSDIMSSWETMHEQEDEE